LLIDCNLLRFVVADIIIVIRALFSMHYCHTPFHNMNGTWLFDLSHACHHWHGTINIHFAARDHSSFLSALRIISLARNGCGVRVIEWVMEGRRGRGVEGLGDVDGGQDVELPLKGVCAAFIAMQCC
jgi:hypothetical protein